MQVLEICVDIVLHYQWLKAMSPIGTQPCLFLIRNFDLCTHSPMFRAVCATSLADLFMLDGLISFTKPTSSV
jgi:hypothetical protein